MNDNKEGQLGGTGPAWGYHGYEYWLTLGNLLHDIAGEEAAWESRQLKLLAEPLTSAADGSAV